MLSTPTMNHRRYRQTLSFLSVVLLLSLAGCGGGSSSRPSGKYYSNDGPPADYLDNHIITDAVPRIEPKSRGGNPKSYVVFGKRYHVLDSSKGYVDRGIASWYGKMFHGRRTSNGEIYDMYAMTAAHKTLPIPTYVEVKNIKTGKVIIVRVNDRGPFHEGRIIDLSYAAAQKLGTSGKGTGLVEVRAIDPQTWHPGQPSQPVRTADASGEANPNAQIYLQLGAFSSRDNAQKLLVKTAGNAISGVFVKEGTTQNGDSIYRVRVGPLATIDLADNMISRLISASFDEFHVVIE
jgi:rare lipoprotein A